MRNPFRRDPNVIRVYGSPGPATVYGSPGPATPPLTGQEHLDRIASEFVSHTKAEAKVGVGFWSIHRLVGVTVEPRQYGPIPPSESHPGRPVHHSRWIQVTYQCGRVEGEGSDATRRYSVSISDHGEI